MTREPSSIFIFKGLLQTPSYSVSSFVFLSVAFILSSFTSEKSKRLHLHCLFCSSVPFPVNRLFFPEMSQPIIIHFLGLLWPPFSFVNDVTVSSVIMCPPCFFTRHNFCYKRTESSLNTFITLWETTLTKLLKLLLFFQIRTY